MTPFDNGLIPVKIATWFPKAPEIDPQDLFQSLPRDDPALPGPFFQHANHGTLATYKLPQFPLRKVKAFADSP
jgi:hypothetical protein